MESSPVIGHWQKEQQPTNREHVAGEDISVVDADRVRAVRLDHKRVEVGLVVIPEGRVDAGWLLCMVLLKGRLVMKRSPPTSMDPFLGFL